MAQSRRQREEAERAEYERLHAKYGNAGRRRPAPRQGPDDEDDDEDDGSIMVFTGRRASSFVERMFGEGAAPPADAGDEDEDDEDEDLDDDEEPDDEPDPKPNRGHRFFQGRG